MEFVGRLAYLVLFPGLLFITAAGTVAWSVARRIASFGPGAPLDPGPGPTGILEPLKSETREGGRGEVEFLDLACPQVKILCLAWVSCAVFGVMSGDVALVYALFALAFTCDALVESFRLPPGGRPGATEAAARALGWLAPLAPVLAGVALRTGQVSVSGVIEWQAANGMLVSSPEGGPLATAGAAVLLGAALLFGSGMAGMRPRPCGDRSGSGAGGEGEPAGVKLALDRCGRAARLFVTALLICALFLAGPASNWHEALSWALKIAGMVAVFALLELALRGLAPRLKVGWTAAAPLALAVAGLALTVAAAA